MRILKLLEFIRDYADQLRDAITNRLADQEEFDHRLPLVEEGFFFYIHLNLECNNFNLMQLLQMIWIIILVEL